MTICFHKIPCCNDIDLYFQHVTYKYYQCQNCSHFYLATKKKGIQQAFFYFTVNLPYGGAPPLNMFGG